MNWTADNRLPPGICEKWLSPLVDLPDSVERRMYAEARPPLVCRCEKVGGGVICASKSEIADDQQGKKSEHGGCK